MPFCFCYSCCSWSATILSFLFFFILVSSKYTFSLSFSVIFHFHLLFDWSVESLRPSTESECYCEQIKFQIRKMRGLVRAVIFCCVLSTNQHKHKHHHHQQHHYSRQTRATHLYLIIIIIIIIGTRQARPSLFI